ncbi:hypothetical protein NDU88_004324 [Pleurodeles waltl]|uniref:Uncharacterized protein n=1 Tax=Pleurodeles waltl TaxID=8319 RepID=A0AAV7LHZ7_PLEWA|nr:hypothetical protein NDU88_004324 [Pleurodeles waltl]
MKIGISGSAHARTAKKHRYREQTALLAQHSLGLPRRPRNEDFLVPRTQTIKIAASRASSTSVKGRDWEILDA